MFHVFFSFLCVAFLVEQNLVLAATKIESHNVEWGARTTNDVLLSREIIREKFKALRIVSNDFEFRQKVSDRFPITRTITKIVVTDQYTDGDGGHATLKNGGPGMNHAIIHLKSQRGHGYHFIIDIYGQ